MQNSLGCFRYFFSCKYSTNTVAPHYLREKKIESTLSEDAFTQDRAFMAVWFLRKSFSLFLTPMYPFPPNLIPVNI